MALGSKLMQAREALGLSQAELAERTHIMVQIVRELENEDYSRFSAAIYGKGFVKLYAKAVGLDPAPLVAEFLADFGDGEAPKKKARAAIERAILDTEPEAPPQQAAAPVQEEPLPVPQTAELFPAEEPAEPAEPAAPQEAPAETPSVQVSQVSAPPLPPTLKASSVTMPNPNAPKAAPVPSPGRPAALRPTPIAQPADRQEPVRAEQDRPRSTAEDLLNRDNVFRLESEQASPAIPPRPVVKNLEPFRYPKPAAATPTPAQQPTQQEAPPPRRRAPAPTAQYAQSDDDAYARDAMHDDASEIFEAPVRKPARQRTRPERNTRPKREGPTMGDYFNHFKLAAATFFASVRERIAELFSASDDEDARTKKHYYISGIAVLGLVAVIIAVAAISHRRTKAEAGTDMIANAPVVEGLDPVEGGSEAVEDGADYAAVDANSAVADAAAGSVGDAAVALSAEIVKVLPAPKVFAR